MTNIKDALEQIRAYVIHNYQWAVVSSQKSERFEKIVNDSIDQALSQLTASHDREKVAACARKCADDLVQIIETATKVAKRTGNTFVIDRQKVATMISGHFAALLETRRK